MIIPIQDPVAPSAFSAIEEQAFGAREALAPVQAGFEAGSSLVTALVIVALIVLIWYLLTEIHNS